MPSDDRACGQNDAASFSLTAYRGDGMVMLAMNWRDGEPPDDFAGFAISCRTPGEGHRMNALRNLLTFPASIDPRQSPLSTRSPFQRFRWVHFPQRYHADGEFEYLVAPVYMDLHDTLRQGETQTVLIALGGETHPGELGVSFTRGFLSSQAFVRNFLSPVGILPAAGDDPLSFTSTNEPALEWLGFGARHAILDALDRALASSDAQVDVIAFDLSEKSIVDRLVALGARLRIIVDDSVDHRRDASAESRAAARLVQSAGPDRVVRQHLGGLQHNKVIIIRGAALQRVVCGSTNFSWRGLYAQNNHVLTLRTADAVAPFAEAFDAFFAAPRTFRNTPSSQSWQPLNLPTADGQVIFSPHSGAHAVLADVAADIASAKHSVFYSLAFLYQTPGVIMDAINHVTDDDGIFVYGISDRAVGGLVLHKEAQNPIPVRPASLTAGKTPFPFSVEPTRGFGVQMHHKFVLIDPSTPDARVYLGSYNFSTAADRSNGENLLLIRDPKVTTSFLVQALSMFDHYSYRVKNEEAPLPGQDGPLPATLRPPPREAGDTPWWRPYYVPGPKQRDRLLFA